MVIIDSEYSQNDHDKGSIVILMASAFLLFFAVENPCEESGCSHICLLSATSETGYTCSCAQGAGLQNDEKTCGRKTLRNLALVPSLPCSMCFLIMCRRRIFA